jgi:hypothetical protein
VFAFVFTLVATRPFVRREPLMLSTYAGLGAGTHHDRTPAGWK